MSDIRFPMSLKPIVNRGYSQTRGSNIWRNDVQGGVPRQGRDTYFEPVPISITLVVSSLGRQAFYSFLNNIHGGADSFIMPNDTGLGVQDHLVWITSQISDNTDDGKNWIISFTATAERTAIQEDTCLTANLPDLFGCYGDCLGAFLRAFGDYMTTFPRVWEPNVIAQFNIVDRVFTGLGFSRAGEGTYIDGGTGLVKTAAAGVPRYEVDGLLIELQVTNRALYSGNLDNSWWTGSRIAKTPGFSAPDGSMNAVKVVGTTEAGAHYISKPLNVSVGETYTLSFFVKAGEVGQCRVNFSGTASTNNMSCDFDLTTGQVVTTTPAGVPSITRLSNGWWRVSARSEQIATAGALNFNLWLINGLGPGASSSPSDGVSGLYVWGAQIEANPVMTSYIPTTTATVTRAADILTLTSGGTPKRVYREYAPLGSATAVVETVPYTGELCPPGHLRVLKVLND